MSLYKYKNIYIYNIKMLNIKYIIFLIFIGVVYYIYTFIKKIHTKIKNLETNIQEINQHIVISKERIIKNLNIPQSSINYKKQETLTKPNMPLEIYSNIDMDNDSNNNIDNEIDNTDKNEEQPIMNNNSSQVHWSVKNIVDIIDKSFNFNRDINIKNLKKFDLNIIKSKSINNSTSPDIDSKGVDIDNSVTNFIESSGKKNVDKLDKKIPSNKNLDQESFIMNEFIITYDDFNIKNSEKISSEQNDIQSSEQNNIQSSEQNDIQSEQNDLNDIQSEQNNYEEIQIDQTKDNSIEEIENDNNSIYNNSDLNLEDLKSNNMKTNFNIDYSINELIEEIEENGEIGEIGEDYNNDNLNKLLENEVSKKYNIDNIDEQQLSINQEYYDSSKYNLIDEQNLKRMKLSELIEFADKNNIIISKKKNKHDLINEILAFNKNI